MATAFYPVDVFVYHTFVEIFRSKANQFIPLIGQYNLSVLPLSEKKRSREATHWQVKKTFQLLSGRDETLKEQVASESEEVTATALYSNAQFYLSYFRLRLA